MKNELRYDRFTEEHTNAFTVKRNGKILDPTAKQDSSSQDKSAKKEEPSNETKPKHP